MQTEYQQTKYDANSDRGITLNRNGIIRFFLTNKYVQPALTTLSVILFFLAIYQTFVGPQDADTNFGAIAFFGLWWAPFLLISLLLFGRIWCYICPIGAINTFLQRFSLNRRFPMFMKQKKIFGLSVSVLSIAAITFIFARLPLYKFGVSWTPWKMGVYFLIFLAVAVIVTLLFERRAFCRYVCPITSAMTVTSKLSPIEFVHKNQTGVKDCVTAEFQSNYLSGDHRCVYCMSCTMEKPEAAVKMRLRWPGVAAVREKMPLADEALMALIIFAVFPIDHVLGKIVAELPVIKELPLFFSKSVPYFTSIIATIFVFALVNKIASVWSGLDAKTAFTRFAFAYLPLGIMFQLGRHVITGLMEEGGALLNGFAAGLGITLHLPEAWASPETVAAWSHFSITGFLWLAALWGAMIAWKVAKDMARNEVIKEFGESYSEVAASAEKETLLQVMEDKKVRNMKTEINRKVLKAFLPHLLFILISTYVVMAKLLEVH
jgi:polyferredoxin